MDNTSTLDDGFPTLGPMLMRCISHTFRSPHTAGRLRGQAVRPPLGDNLLGWQACVWTAQHGADRQGVTQWQRTVHVQYMLHLWLEADRDAD